MARKIVGEDGRTYVEKKPIYKRWWFIVLVVIVVIGYFGSKQSAEKPASASTTNTQSVVTQAPPPEPEEVTYYVGDTVSVGKLIATVIRYEELTELSSDNMFIENVTTDDKFVLIEIKLTNDDKKSRTFDTSMFRLYDNRDRNFKPYSGFNINYILGEANLFLESVNPGVSRTGIVVFEVPEDMNEYWLDISGGIGFASGSNVKVKIK